MGIVGLYSTGYGEILEVDESLVDRYVALGWLPISGGGGGGGVTDSAVAQQVTSGAQTKGALDAAYTATVLTVATATSSATLVGDKHTPVDATSGALTMTLPTPTRVGQQVRVEKVDASANAVTVTGTLRGSAGTIAMPFQYEVLTFVAESLSSWRVASGNKTKAALDATYSQKAPAFERFGSNMWLGDPSGSLTTDQITNSVATMTAQFGPRPLLLVFHIAYDSGGVLRIVQHGFNNTGHSEAKVDQAVSLLKAAGFSIFAIKVHQNGITAGQVNAQFWTDYRALIATLTAKYRTQSIPWFYPVNEFEAATGNSANTSAMQGMNSDVKAAGFKLGYCFNALNEASRCTVLADLDGVGVNVYPSVSTKGLNTSPEEVMAAWDAYAVIEWFRYRRLVAGQKCYITETGSSDKAVSLEYTPDFSVSNYPDNNGAIVGTYWEGTLRFLAANGDVVDGCFGWDDGIFNPFKFTSSLAVMKKYAKAGAR